MPSSTNTNINVNNPVNSEDEGDTNAGGSVGKTETDAKVKEAFEYAAKELGMKVKFQGGYIVIDKECPAGTQEQLKKAEGECADATKKDPDPTDPPPAEEKPLEDKKCAIGNPAERQPISGRVMLNDKIPGTRFTYAECVKSEAFPGNKQVALDNVDRNLLANNVFAFQQLEKFLQATGASGTVTSGMRTEAYAKSQGWATNSQHNTGYAIDFKPSGSVKGLFKKVIELYTAGKLCGAQFIYELGGSRDSGIIHFDFSSRSPGKKGPMVGKQGKGNPYYEVTNVADLEAAITKRLGQ